MVGINVTFNNFVLRFLNLVFSSVNVGLLVVPLRFIDVGIAQSHSRGAEMSCCFENTEQHVADWGFGLEFWCARDV